jgi:hypothetical protein
VNGRLFVTIHEHADQEVCFVDGYEQLGDTRGCVKEMDIHVLAELAPDIP